MNGDVPKIYITTEHLARLCRVPFATFVSRAGQCGFQVDAIFLNPDKSFVPVWDVMRSDEICRTCFGYPAQDPAFPSF